jgi:hypothetical protein
MQWPKDMLKARRAFVFRVESFYGIFDSLKDRTGKIKICHFNLMPSLWQHVHEFR